MIRICTSLANAGYDVLLVGTKTIASKPLSASTYRQKRLKLLFTKGKLFYIEFNIRLLLFLLHKTPALICAVDLDTILPCYIVSRIKNIPRLYDAHELFCEMKEVVTRPLIYRFWKRIEQLTVPNFTNGYTVNEPIKTELKRMYRRDYAVIRNVPLLKTAEIPEKIDRHFLYQGAVNEGRCFETLIPAMQYVDAQLIICGDGNFMDQTKDLITKYNLSHKIVLAGKVLPADLPSYTNKAWAGITLFDKTGLSNYYSLANRFFDYIHAGIPQLCVNYPVYAEINNLYKIGVLIDNVGTLEIAEGLNLLLKDLSLYRQLQQNCLLAREKLNWQHEEQKLLEYYKKIIG
ncbi:MAG: glycosyltransferase [Chitinophagaceae bacterium]|nr:glycosyltransferase [Chitinophagaceae bacterium]